MSFIDFIVLSYLRDKILGFIYLIGSFYLNNKVEGVKMGVKQIYDVIENARIFMKKKNIDSWVLYDFKGSNPIFWRVIGRKLSTSRRCFLFIFKEGKPKILTQMVDKHLFKNLGIQIIDYTSREDMEEKMNGLLKNIKVITMEYSQRANIPYIGRVDAGTIELLIEREIEVISSGDIFQYSAARWTREEFDTHLEAVKKIVNIKDEAFEFARKKIVKNQHLTEFEVQEFIMQRFAQEKMITEDRPIVAVNENTSNPHYTPTKNESKRIEPESLLMIDLWAKKDKINSIYSDITWMAYFGKKIPEDYEKVFDIIAEARNKVIYFLKNKLRDKSACAGWELDKIARDVISSRGFSNQFIHRTGHSIGTSLHGDSVNLDNYESKDTRTIIPGIGFTIEPGIYFDEWGIRSEINVYINETKPIVTTPIQESIIKLF
jgi:Xaa-Pro aminopeptidase